MVHLLAVAGRMPGVEVTLDGEVEFADDTGLDSDVVSDFDRIGRKTPLLVDLKPSGQNYMEDLHKVGYLIGNALTEQRRAASLVSSAR